MIKQVELSEFGLFEVRGDDALKFLQGQLTCDVSKVTETHSVFGAHCDPKGRMQSFFKLFLRDGAYCFQLPKASVEAAMTALQKYSVFYKSTMTDLTDSVRRVGFIGDEADAIHSSKELVALCFPGRTEVLGSQESVAAFCETVSTKVEMGSWRDWHLADIEMGLPQVYPDTVGKLLPHYANLSKLGAISFDKGCYTGQEIIARMEYLGKLKQSMYYVVGDFSKLDGELVDTCKDAEGESHSLLILKTHTEAPSSVSINPLNYGNLQ